MILYILKMNLILEIAENKKSSNNIQIIGGLIWENLGPSWVFIVATLVDLLIRLPLLITVPETLKKNEE